MENWVVLRKCGGTLLLQGQRKWAETNLDETSNKFSLAKFIVRRMKVHKKSPCYNEKKTLPVLEKKIYILSHIFCDTLICQNSVRTVQH